jgi:PAS domain-containing protein
VSPARRWEVFRSRGRAGRAAALTIARDGLFLNRAAYAALGRPESVTLGFDFTERVIRIAPDGDCHLRTAQSRHRVAAGEFLDWIGLTVRGSQRYPAQAVAGELHFHLGAGEPLRAPQSPRRRAQ